MRVGAEQAFQFPSGHVRCDQVGETPIFCLPNPLPRAKTLLHPRRGLLSGAALAFVLSTPLLAVVVDGDAGDWSSLERLDGVSYYTLPGYEVYGTYDSSSYLFALRAPDPVGVHTTVWLNTDLDATTGHQVFGFAGGAEWNINFFSDGAPYLYTGAAAEVYVLGPLPYATSVDGRFVEFELPASWLGLASPSPVDLLVDVNNSAFIPPDYSRGSLSLVGPLPPRIDFAKRVAFVYSETTEANFFQPKAYSQLQMALQHQSMQAGIGFDLISESALLDVANIVNYDVLVLPFFAYAKASEVDTITQTLQHAVYRYGIGVISGDNLLTNDESGAAFPGDAFLRMKRVLGIQRFGGYGPAPIELRIADQVHPMLENYSAGEVLLDVSNGYTSYFGAIAEAQVEAVVVQETFGSVNGAVLAIDAPGRSVHFASLSFLADTHLVWPAILWSIYGSETSYGLKLGRQKSLFVARNDMDQSMFVDEVPLVYPVLLPLLALWKARYDFVGSYYINLGNNRRAGEYTDWNLSGPYLLSFLDLANEVSTHSYTHPHQMNTLSAAQIAFEFADSAAVIEQNLPVTVLGGAIPGAPDTLATALEISNHLDYVSGGYSGVGAGYPNAFGFLRPGETTVYLSPNMTFDFSNVEFLGHTAEETEQIWAGEYDRILTHSNQPIVHWPWHDYGPTVSLPDGYTVAMYENTIAMAHADGAEFLTGDDLHRRINAQQGASVLVLGNTITVTGGAELGSMAIEARGSGVIRNVGDWFAFNETHVLLPSGGGLFTVESGTVADDVVHLTDLPMRSVLQSVVGDGVELAFTFVGQGAATVYVPLGLQVAALGADTTTRDGTNLTLTFNTLAEHTVEVFPSVTSTIADANFDSSSQGFVYRDDLFRSTSQPGYATGARVSSGGFSGGALRTTLGGINNNDILGMSGGWELVFNLVEPLSVRVDFRYRLSQAANYEVDESADALLSIDGVLYGASSNDYHAQIHGNGNGGTTQTTGWRSGVVQTEVLPGGVHRLAIGVYNNKKTYFDESTEILIDDVSVVAANAVTAP